MNQAPQYFKINSVAIIFR